MYQRWKMGGRNGMSDKQRTGGQRNLRGRAGDDLLSTGTAWNREILENTKCTVSCDPVYGLYFYQEHDRKREAGAVEAGGMEKTVRGRGEEPGIVAAVSDVVRAA